MLTAGGKKLGDDAFDVGDSAFTLRDRVHELGEKTWRQNIPAVTPQMPMPPYVTPRMNEEKACVFREIDPVTQAIAPVR